MKRILAIIIFFMCTGLLVQAQEQLTKRQLAERAFERYEYYRSLNLYLELIGKVHYQVHDAERIADCYRLMNDDVNAEAWYARLITEPQASLNVIYYYAEALLHNHKFEAAKVQYKSYYQHFNSPQQLNFKLATCDSAAAWIKRPNAFAVKNDKQLNSYYADWGATRYGKNGTVFVSDRRLDEKRKGIDQRSGNQYTQLFLADGESVVLMPLDTKGSEIFKGDYHTGPVAFNATADTAYITITTNVPVNSLPKEVNKNQRLYTRRLQLVMATKAGSKWSNFINLPFNNVQQYSVGHAALSRDGQLLYFASDMPGGKGETDIWYCEKQADGTWSKPVNCGPIINTAEAEAFPMLNGDVLYYSSKGLPGMGGYDLFRAVGSKNQWTKPENLRFPANSTRDDFYLTTADGLNGYLSSNREGGIGSDDIYHFSYTPPPAAAIKPALKPDAPGHKQPDFNAPKIPMLAVIYYNLDKYSIRTDAIADLDRVVQALKSNPTIRIEIASFTDIRASTTYNMALSARRSAAVAAYLIKNGIAMERFITRNYGESRPVSQCDDEANCTEAEHQLNRRTEIRILGQ
ncbi:OmpA family protein [Mucilaginibacter koreensis]